MSKAKEFEQQIARIYEVLAAEADQVKWDDNIPDPDNAKQRRQIHITVRRGEEVTHIECRSHRERQDTKWIEELVGRKSSLGATTMIAVSDSGFTRGAMLKAKKLGIFLRALNEVSKDEIKSWGRTTAISIYYYALSNISFRFTFQGVDSISHREVATALLTKRDYIASLFNTLKYWFNQQRDVQFPYCFRVELEAHNMELCNTPVHRASVQGEVDELTYKVGCPILLEFEEIDDREGQAIATIERSNRVAAEVITAQNGLTAIHFDLSSSPQAPPNSILAGIFKFHSISTENGRLPKFNIVGSQEQWVELTHASFAVTPI
jgi:hypothetical protein